MLTLIKYELFKTKTLLTILAVITGLSLVLTACLTAFVDMGIFFSSMIVGTFLSGISLFTILYAILIYYKDISKKVGYMTYLTPHNQFEIIGAKIIATGIVTVLAWLSLAIMIFVNYLLLKNFQVETYEKAVEVYEEIFFNDFNFFPTLTNAEIIIYCISVMLSSFTMPIYIIFSMTFMYTVFPVAKCKGLWTVLVYLITVNIINAVSGVFKNVNFQEEFSLSEYMASPNEYLTEVYSNAFSFTTILTSAIVTVVTGIILYVISSILAEKKLSV